MTKITAIPAFNDNYLWAIQTSSSNNAAIVDPGDAKPVMHFLEQHQLNLSAILITHWHPDHIGGVDKLTQAFPNTMVIGPDSQHIPQVKHTVNDGDICQVMDIEFQCIAVPGHTLDHIAFYAKTENILFCGDTLFAGGCGRIFEGNPAMMLNSLKKLANLPPATQFYCAHEYTESNLRFALEAEPSNALLQQRFIDCQQLRAKQAQTIPATIQDELDTNPFLRAHKPEVITQALKQGANSSNEADIFACLREWKNNF